MGQPDTDGAEAQLRGTPRVRRGGGERFCDRHGQRPEADVPQAGSGGRKGSGNWGGGLGCEARHEAGQTADIPAHPWPGKKPPKAQTWACTDALESPGGCHRPHRRVTCHRVAKRRGTPRHPAIVTRALHRLQRAGAWPARHTQMGLGPLSHSEDPHQDPSFSEQLRFQNAHHFLEASGGFLSLKFMKGTFCL